LKAAKKRGLKIEVVEWPGGEQRQIELDVGPEVFAAVKKGRMSLPLGTRIDLTGVAGLPWCSIATLHSNGESLHRVVGPASRQAGRWALPVLYWFYDPDTGLKEYEQEGKKLRKEWGLEPRKV
jgi:hypothetical protein